VPEVARSIVAFHRDEASDWIAELDCGHRRHVRHDPPLNERPWVLDEEGRADKLGARFDCKACARRELPEGHTAYRRTETFDENTIPPGLRRSHSTRGAVWARIHVEQGRLRYRVHAPFDDEQVLEPAATGVVLPEIKHEVEPLGAVRFYVEFYRPSP
jgi:tellurite resistance-related uncharacterized protein